PPPLRLSRVGIPHSHGAHAPILSRAGLHYLPQPVGGIVILCLCQVDDVTNSHIPNTLGLVIQHPAAEHLLHPLLPELPLCFLYELQPLCQARCFLEPHLGHLHGGPSQLQVQRSDGPPCLWIACVLGYRSAIHHLSRLRHHRAELTQREPAVVQGTLQAPLQQSDEPLCLAIVV
ncbi:MAG: hypothetical protein ACK56I_14045, partial [bacterium]